MLSVKRVLSIVSSATATYIYARALHTVFVRDANSVVVTSYGGHLQFVTILTLFASLLRQITCFLYSISGIRSLNALQSWLGILTTPIEVIVTMLYWPLKIYKNGLVKDNRFGLVIDPELDRMCHLYPAIFEFITSTALCTRKWPRGNIIPFLVFSAVSGGYWLWFETTFKHNGFYPYPLLAILDTQKKAILIGCCTIVAFLTYKLVLAFQRK